MRDLQPTFNQLRCFEFELPSSSTEKGRKQTRDTLSAYSTRSSSRNAYRPRATSACSHKLPTSGHKCISIGDITQPKDCQHILVGSALRRPHATGYSPMDYQTMPDVGKAPRKPYRPKTAGTVYGYANRPVSAAEVGNKNGKQTKSSLLRKKSSSSCDLLSSPSSFELLSQGTSTNTKKRLCKVREDYRPFKSGHHYQQTTPNGESIHSFLIGARYNNTRYVDSKTFSKLGMYIPKADLKTFFIKENNWTTPHDDDDVNVDKNELNIVAFINQASEEVQSNPIDKVFENSANTENKAINTEPHYLSIDRWHSADWHTDRKPTSQKASRAHTAPSRFKPINTFYYDYDSGKKYKYRT